MSLGIVVILRHGIRGSEKSRLLVLFRSLMTLWAVTFWGRDEWKVGGDKKRLWVVLNGRAELPATFLGLIVGPGGTDSWGHFHAWHRASMCLHLLNRV